MDKKLACALGAAAALTTMTAAHAAAPAQATELAPATSYRDLLDPIPNALAVLKADDARLAEAQEASAIQPVQYYYREYREHHHYRPRFFFRFGRPYRRPYYRRYHHHHHHHHHSYFG